MQCNWKDACKGDLKRAHAISVLMEKHPDLMRWLFKDDKPELKTSPEEMLRRAGAFSTGERILIRVALDLWSGDGNTKVMELDRLDPGNFENALHAISLMRSF